MKGTYQLVTDASANLIKEFVEKESVGVIPMTYMLGDEDRITYGVDSPEVLKWYYDGAKSGLMTRTSQITPQVYEEFFKEYAKRGESLIYLSLSGGLSSTYDSSCLAASIVMEEYPDVVIRCVDSRSTAGGLELLLEHAAKNRSEGMSLEDNAAWLEEHRLEVCHWFMVEDLMYLKRNGRISSATALIGTALNVKPILRIEEDGSLVNFAKKRGDKGAWNQILAYYDEASSKEDGERVYVIHTDNEAGAAYLEEGVKKLNPKCVITKAVLTPIIGCHTGPGMCAIIHMGKRIL